LQKSQLLFFQKSVIYYINSLEQGSVYDAVDIIRFLMDPSFESACR
jgi:hypothetical protein